MTHARVLGAATTITSRYWVDEDAVTVTAPTVAVADGWLIAAAVAHLAWWWTPEFI